MRIWIDTDVGSDVDDAIALAYVMRHAGFELCGVSTVFGDVPLRTQIARRLLDLGDHANIEVWPGLGVPLTPRRKGIMFGFEGHGIVEGANPIARVKTEDGGPERVAALARAIEAAAPDVLLAIGPLTNLGALIDHGVDLPPLAIMGGKLSDVLVDGMSPDIFEWNWFCDSDAARMVIEAPHAELPLVVPGEVTFQTRLADGDIELLQAGDPLNQMVATLSQGWLDAQRDLWQRDKPRVALHDPLTAALLIEPTLCSVEDRRITFDAEGVSHVAPGDANAVAATTVDATATRDHLMATLLGS